MGLLYDYQVILIFGVLKDFASSIKKTYALCPLSIPQHVVSIQDIIIDTQA